MLWFIARFRRTRVNTYTLVHGHFWWLIFFECVQNWRAVLRRRLWSVKCVDSIFLRNKKTKINTVVICKNEYFTVLQCHSHTMDRTPKYIVDSQYSQTDNKQMKSKCELQNAAVNPRTPYYKQYGWNIVAPDASVIRLVPPSMRRQSGCLASV